MTTIIPFDEGEKNLDWLGLARAFDAGHQRPKRKSRMSFSTAARTRC